MFCGNAAFNMQLNVTGHRAREIRCHGNIHFVPSFRSLADSWADTTTPHGELMITILAGLATFERHLIRARTDEGRKRAQARGVRFGRPLKLSAFQINEALARREAGENLTDIGRSYGVSHSTISRLTG